LGEAGHAGQYDYVHEPAFLEESFEEVGANLRPFSSFLTAAALAERNTPTEDAPVFQRLIRFLDQQFGLWDRPLELPGDHRCRGGGFDRKTIPSRNDPISTRLDHQAPVTQLFDHLRIAVGFGAEIGA
jgi:hypothetical protein